MPRTEHKRVAWTVSLNTPTTRLAPPTPTRRHVQPAQCTDYLGVSLSDLPTVPISTTFGCKGRTHTWSFCSCTQRR